MGIGFISSIEATVRQLGTNGWSQKIKTKTVDQFYKKLEMLIGDKEDCPHCFRKMTKTSYRLSIKVNGGYGKDHDTGATSIINWTGTLDQAMEMAKMIFK